MEPVDPFPELLARSRVVLLDGGLATELERQGQDLHHRLWSARLLAENPEAIHQVHRAFADAGAQVLITSSYQGNVPGLEAAGYSSEEARELLVRSVDLARQCGSENLVVVAASVGPYGAFLADGSEYRGNYGVSVDELREWHRPRIQVLQETEADLLALETIPSLEEVEALMELLDDYGHVRAWISFCCRTPEELAEGTSLEDAVLEVRDHPQIVAIGINCVAPDIVPETLDHLHSLTAKPILAYPNSGETFDAVRKTWSGKADPQEFADAAMSWHRSGCRIIGGCCRTTPAHIAELRTRFDP